MADFFVWTAEELGLGVHEMDSEHQVLINKMNALHRGAKGNLPYEELAKLVDNLAQYTVQHFADEEAYMAKTKFDGLASHKIIHQQLLSQFQGFVEEFKTKKIVSDSFFNFLKVWLTSHIRGIDMKYANNAKKKAS